MLFLPPIKTTFAHVIEIDGQPTAKEIRSYDFIGVVFATPENADFTVGVDWPRLSLQFAGLGVVALAFNRRKAVRTFGAVR